MFRAGREALERGDVTEACTRFKESYRLDAAAGTLVNLAMCEETLGYLATAWEHFRRAVDVLPPTDERLPVIQERLRELEKRVPRITLRLTEGSPPSTRVVHDGVSMAQGTFGVPVPLDPGPHVFVATAEGREDRRYELEIHEGESLEMEIDAGPPVTPPIMPDAAMHSPVQVPLAPAPPAALPAQRRPPSETVGYILLGAAGAALIGAGVAAVPWAVKQGEVDDHCRGSTCDATGLRAASAASVLQVATLASLGASAALAATGVVLLAVAPSPNGGAPAAPLGVIVSGRF